MIFTRERYSNHLGYDYESNVVKQLYWNPLCWGRGRFIFNDVPNNIVLCNKRPEVTLSDEEIVNIDVKQHSISGGKQNSQIRSIFAAAEEVTEDEEDDMFGKSKTRNKTEGSSSKSKKLNEEQLAMMSKDELKRWCRYRLSCYAENGMLNDLVSEKQKRLGPSIGISRKSDLKPKKSKRTVKEIANFVVRQMNEDPTEGQKNPKMNPGHRERLDRAATMEMKLKCKYRKSCYESTSIEKIKSSEPNVKEIKKLPGERKISFEDMDEYERKIFCRFRKSCYGNGVRPVLDSKIFGVPLLDTYLVQNPKVEKEEEEVKVKPTNVKELKLFCKYRKSCYITQASMATTNKEEDEKSSIRNEVTNQKLAESEEDERSDEEEKDDKEDQENNVDEKENVLHEEEKSNQKEIKIKKGKRKRRYSYDESEEEEFYKHRITKFVEKKSKKLRASVNKKPKVIPVSLDQLENAVEEASAVQDKEVDATEMSIEVPDVPVDEPEEVNKKVRMRKKYDIGKAKTETQAPLPRIWSKRSRSAMVKLQCKYRKSCYQTHIFPKSTHAQDDVSMNENLWNKFRTVFPTFLSPSHRKEVTKIENWKRLSKAEKMNKCRFQKSCYKKQEEWHRKDDKIIVPIIKNAPSKEVRLDLEEHGKMIKTEEKLACKYRKSCYDSEYHGRVIMIPQKNINVLIRENDVNEKCNAYRISCRQKLGLPIVERAPIGPNGKKLCRRQNKTSNVVP